MEACNWYGDVSLINVFIMTFLKRKQGDEQLNLQILE